MADKGFISKPLRQLSHEEKDKLRDIIYYKNGFNREWGWKDPRTCLFLDVYNELIPGAFYFVVLRDYQSVVSSLICRMYKQSIRQKRGYPDLGHLYRRIIKANKYFKYFKETTGSSAALIYK